MEIHLPRWVVLHIFLEDTYPRPQQKWVDVVAPKITCIIIIFPNEIGMDNPT